MSRHRRHSRMRFGSPASQFLEIERGGREQRLNLHFGAPSKLRLGETVLRFRVRVDALTNDLSLPQQSAAPSGCESRLHLFEEVGVPASSDDAISHRRWDALHPNRAMPAASSQRLVHRLAARDVLTRAPQLLPLWTDVEVARRHIGEGLAIKAAMRVRARPDAEQRLHISLHAHLPRRLTPVAAVTDQFTRRSLQHDSILVDWPSLRVPFAFMCTP